jgi:Na+-translocating ferredoxin:NAD+ oxidoreductase RnfG subunit
MTAKKQPSELISLTLILFLFSAVTALLLGLVNSVTGTGLLRSTRKNKIRMQEVLMAENSKK